MPPASPASSRREGYGDSFRPDSETTRCCLSITAAGAQRPHPARTALDHSPLIYSRLHFSVVLDCEKYPKDRLELSTIKGKTEIGPSPSHSPHINNVKTVFQYVSVKTMSSSKHLTANSVLSGRLTAPGLASIQN